ncbi:hypothetical protein [Phaeobacter sp.]|uniref:hypothetical protein n=1 Tax=Phaeobacter sp. TaxID=1902409 RepID=UPI0025E7339A|nr:hypothetical protein [Phaeobacter sp.]
MLKAISIAYACLLPLAAWAEDPRILEATATQTGGSWRISVTISHPDTGWDHYADGWRVLDAEGNQLGLRVLAHPHVDEQPFTRSLAGVVVPAGLQQVQIQARCNVDGWAEEVYVLELNCTTSC